MALLLAGVPPTVPGTLGCSGARILGSLAHELRRRGGGLGLAAICIGVGQGLAVVLES
jgi:acetyl-CoA acetyltransferase